jgi:geranylgeranyl diphosphate synthase type II
MMDPSTRIESALENALVSRAHADSPPQLAEAVRYALFPGGGRMRPRLSLAVAGACGDDAPKAADAAAAAIEMLHCASLIHDDLPCFDDAQTRRGKPSVHVAYGERLAVLAGDALIVLAFETLADAAEQAPARLPALLRTLGRSVGLPSGICAGQGWECEPGGVPLDKYEQLKTGSLFAAATTIGAQAAGHDGAAWRTLGAKLGEAYQVADDIRDVYADADDLGKPVGRDEALDRPSAVRELGLEGAKARLNGLVEDAVTSIPACPGRAQLIQLIRAETSRFLPKALAQAAA